MSEGRMKDLLQIVHELGHSHRLKRMMPWQHFQNCVHWHRQSTKSCLPTEQIRTLMSSI